MSESDRVSYHMSKADFRKHGYELVDWIAEYLDRVETLPVLSQVEPGEIRARLPRDPPAHGEPFQNCIKDVDEIILPGITHWQSPNFFAYFPANSSGPAILGELLSAGLGIQGMLWATSPAATELETHVLDWLVQMLDLPKHFHSDTEGGAVIQDTASGSTLCALLAAREVATGFLTRQSGLSSKLVAYASNQAHSSLDKAMIIAGLGTDNLRHVPVDADFKMIPEQLERMIQEDLKAGFKPVFVQATVGTTSSNAIDPVGEIGGIAKRHGLWLHVDAAMSGTAAICPEFRHIHDGLEFADSYTFNPHKWMFTNFDCNCFFIRDRKVLIGTLSVLPEYLRNAATESGAVIDYRDWHIPLGRRFRALKLWFVIRHYGIEGLRHHIRRHIALAQEFASWVKEHPKFELAAPTPLNLVCFRHVGGDAINQHILDAVNRSGKMYITHTRLANKLTLRMAIGQTYTEQTHVRNAWDLICRVAETSSDASISEGAERSMPAR